MVNLYGQENPKEIKLITLDPGHFHAALIQKSMYPQMSSEVYVYAPAGTDVDLHLTRIKGYNSRSQEPTKWEEKIYIGKDYLQKMLAEKKGNVVMLAGNNKLKTKYIADAITAGFHVYADKPMAINTAGYHLLEKAFKQAEQKNIMIYDIMTERYEITSMLQKAFSTFEEVFGVLQNGSLENPSVIKESVHHFYKEVSGSPLQRPAWFYDVTQEGEGIVDVTTHLVDLVQWSCFPDQTLNYERDIQLMDAKRWATVLSPSQFMASTKVSQIPDYLKNIQTSDGQLSVFSNGQIDYKIKGHHAQVKVTWAWQAEPGAGDTHYSIMRGTNSSLVIRQGKEQGYQPVFSVESNRFKEEAFRNTFERVFRIVAKTYPGISYLLIGNAAVFDIPAVYKEGHEAHFARVTEKFLDFLSKGKMPSWEVPNILVKYKLTTEALNLASKKAK
ncbi:MAG: oxidoreductase [Bacteroidetes bacterium]|nr:oxidoreductase [Bacteroidota bacterium]